MPSRAVPNYHLSSGQCYGCLSSPFRGGISMPSFRMRLCAALVVAVACLLGLARPAGAVSSTIVVSQVYGGGGNVGATYKNDFIELYNRSAAPVSVNGWSVQYASTTGTTWQRTALSGTIAAGGDYLVQEAAGGWGAREPPPP